MFVNIGFSFKRQIEKPITTILTITINGKHTTFFYVSYNAITFGNRKQKQFKKS